LAYPIPAHEIIVEEGDVGGRTFLSGPFDVGFAMLLTRTCSMSAQGAATAVYAHPVRCLSVIRPLDELVRGGIFDKGRIGLLRSYDPFFDYMYLPEMPENCFPESVALLYMTVTLHHDMIDGQRIAQLTYESAQQLQRKLVHFSSSLAIPRDEFRPPMD
jgi:hypothetical protein